MYDELVKALRETDFGDTCVLCEHEDMCKGNDCIIIQAADAIEVLQKAVNFHKFNSEFWKDKYNSLADGKWIPVTERLPDVGETILDTTFSVDVFGFDGWNYRRAYYNYTAKVWLNGNDEEEWPEITHWMPMSKDALPEPPKEET